MDQWLCDKVSQTVTNSVQFPNSGASQISQFDSRHEAEVKDPVVVRKVQKADREKLRRERLNEQFIELGNALDPERPKNDKATILTDTIQLLRELTAEVNKLKAECSSLSEESRELMQEKNELREEKASLKSDIESLNAQYQQRVRVMFPWTSVEPSVVMAAPPYSYPMPMPIPPGPIPMHPSLQPYPFFGNQNATALPNHPPFIPYTNPPNPHVEQQPVPHASASRVSSKPDSESKASECRNSEKASHAGRTDDSSEVATELELKTPGSARQQESSSTDRKGKHSQKKDRSTADGGSSSKHSCPGPQESSSNSVGHVPVPDK
ncbi:hypothetical protein RND81_11G233400 [Saponaria officinalis]|uniref:BHLH domain-containing protein n=1 Tax=Saponaria officinalis TaxID=3572 RepID=A0AAW1HQU8_SAPOF